MRPEWKAETFWRDFFKQAKGRRQPGSGNQLGKPADIRFIDRVTFHVDDNALLEAKHTDKASLSIRGEWLEKIDLEAAQLGRMPLLGITIGNVQWLCIPTWAIRQDRSESRSDKAIKQGGKDGSRDD